MTANPERRAAPPRSGRRTLLVMAAIALAPIVLSTAIYLFFPRAAETNYGRLLDVAPAPELAGRQLDGTPFRLSTVKRRWVVLVAAGGGCDPACQRELYATRQARTMQGAEQERVVRVWLVSDTVAPSPMLLRDHPGLMVAYVDASALARLPAGPAAIYLLDPLGNLVLQYPESPDVKAMAKDWKRLLRASSIG